MFHSSRYSAHTWRLHMTLAVLLCGSFVLVCSQVEDKSAEIDTGSSCEPLANPDHGNYQCQPTEAGVKCKLMCNTGYILPINEYKNDGQHIPLEERGFYHCVETPGGWLWRPNTFYDCIPKVSPAYFVYYYSVTLPQTCKDDTDRERFLNSFQVNNKSGTTRAACQREQQLNCFWTYDMRCLNKTWLMDVWFRIPFNLDMLDKLEDWYQTFDSYSRTECTKSFTVEGQHKLSRINRSGFYIECPVATRIENDYSCRKCEQIVHGGCSKGYYMFQRVLECQPCPPQHYQDNDYSHTCKPCPAGGDKAATGLTKLIDCFHFSRWEESTSLQRMFAGLTCVVLLSALLLFYRSQIRNEPDGKHREAYFEYEIDAVGGGPLQHVMRELHPMAFFPSQFDNMSVAAQAPTETSRFGTQSGKSKLVTLVKKRPTSESSSGSSDSSGSSSD